MPRVAIILPTWNKAGLLAQALQSLRMNRLESHRHFKRSTQKIAELETPIAHE